MQDQPIGGSRCRAHQLNPQEVAVDRAVLGALISDPTESGQPVETIVSTVDHPAERVGEAIEFLVWLEVLDQCGPRVRASGRTLYLAQLWEVAT